ncbi:unnamed protein product [Leuciscus chuanchicus]
MMKLKLNLLQGDLAERFSVSKGLVSKIFSYWIDTMEEHMRIYIPWLPRETIWSTMPQCFREKFSNTTCIIDCTETTLQKPHNLDSRGERIANVRIHVERVIRRLKVFRIMSQTVSINLAHKMDKILRICAALVNMQGEIIHEDAD